MFRVSFQGFRNDMYLPSGDIWAAAISGLPKKRSRSMIGGKPADPFAGDFADCCATDEKAKSRNRDRIVVIRFFISTPCHAAAMPDGLFAGHQALDFIRSLGQGLGQPD